MKTYNRRSGSDASILTSMFVARSAKIRLVMFFILMIGAVSASNDVNAVAAAAICANCHIGDETSEGVYEQGLISTHGQEEAQEFIEWVHKNGMLAT